MARESVRASPFLMAWLVLSFLLNLSGIASIIDGLVIWAEFLRDLISLYRGWVREPVVALINAVLPLSLQLPAWSGDVLAIWTAFFLVDNIDTAITLGQTSVGFAIRTEGLLRGVIDSVLRFLFFPLLFCLGLWDYATGRMQSRYFRGTFRWQAGIFALVIAALIVLLFLNYQLMRRGG